MSNLFNLDVYVGNETLIDFDVFRLWLDGYTAEEAASYQLNESFTKSNSQDLDLLIQDITDEYRLISILESYLVDPVKFNSQIEFLIGKENQSLLLEMYYEFDDIVIQEILSKKLSSRHRNLLDNVCEKVNISNKSCKRQFDNFRRVFKKTEDSSIKLVDSIIHNFNLSKSLAEEYAVAVFIANSRLDLFKKKIAHVSFNIIIYCAKIIMINWTTFGENENDDGYDGELNKQFVQELKSFKILLKKDILDEHKRHVVKEINDSETPLNNLEDHFKVLSKILVTIACSINNLKCLKDFYTDLQEKFIETCHNLNWTKEDVNVFFKTYIASVRNIQHIKRYYRPSAFYFIWEKYIKTVAECVNLLFEL